MNTRVSFKGCSTNKGEVRLLHLTGRSASVKLQRQSLSCEQLYSVVRIYDFSQGYRNSYLNYYTVPYINMKYRYKCQIQQFKLCKRDPARCIIHSLLVQHNLSSRQLAFLTKAKMRHFWGTVCPRERFQTIQKFLDILKSRISWCGDSQRWEKIPKMAEKIGSILSQSLVNRSHENFVG